MSFLCKAGPLFWLLASALSASDTSFPSGAACWEPHPNKLPLNIQGGYARFHAHGQGNLLEPCLSWCTPEANCAAAAYDGSRCLTYQPDGNFGSGDISQLVDDSQVAEQDRGYTVYLPDTDPCDGYFRTEEKMSWYDASDYCEAHGAHLAIVNDAQEQSLMWQEFYEKGGWIGLTDQGNEGTWEWLDGSSASYTNWYPGEPNNYQGNENCAYINFWASQGGQWSDFVCDNGGSTWGICEIGGATLLELEDTTHVSGTQNVNARLVGVASAVFSLGAVFLVVKRRRAYRKIQTHVESVAV